ncbi:helix-turn-helix domain-containing protein [Bacillus solitudinis]|uniref:helix-turn-helix domain-containing protein n=1 Tax=Bacillus solitudinis TaxID=2014074 RepID=UPI000C245AFB|nr:helix-turn-helix transcriptional regulator [Bacillus solitudinis]
MKFVLKKVMKEKGMTSIKLAELTGMHKNGIYKLANNKTEGIQFQTLGKLTKALDCRVEDLFEYMDNEEDHKA